MAATVREVVPYPEAAEPERPPPALTSDLLEEILLRVASPADLARASTACVFFRRLVADHSFLRRYRFIHPPLLLGFVSSFGFHIVQAPHPSAAVALIVAQAADFSFDYLPRSTSSWFNWRPCDVRNGRVLIRCRNRKGPAYWDLAVCDLLSRRYLLLPHITDDLLASVEIEKQDMFPPRASFIPSGCLSGGIEEDTSFSLILWMQSNTRLGVFVFSSVSGCWSVAEGYIFLGGIPIEQDGKHPVFFSLEIKSFKIERVITTSSASSVHPYFGFPPSMSPIRIQGHGEE